MTEKIDKILPWSGEKHELRGIVVAGMGGGSGKSVVAVGMVAAYSEQGLNVVPFKKGPDYIDAGWLHLAAGGPCYNLDPYLMTDKALVQSFQSHAMQADMVIVEGNRGLYDGVDLEGTYSSAELALSLGLPVLLVVDCTKTTRTVAAMVLGCLKLDSRVDIRGVVLNRIGSSRHESVVRRSVERYTDVRVLGAIPRMKKDVFPMRHLGVTPYLEHEEAGGTIVSLARGVREYLDLAAIETIMAGLAIPDSPVQPDKVDESKVRIGIIRDAAFQFYYPENIEALVNEGAEIVEINALTDSGLPDLDGLYIGGGFPETSVRQLSANVSFKKSVKELAQNGLPIYAECGGLIYLGEGMVLEGVEFPLVGLFPVKFSLEEKPQAHGYTILEVSAENPFYPKSTVIKGHEFRYSKVMDWDGDPDKLAFSVNRGVGFACGRDGLVFRNVLALYTHVHAVATPEWAKGLVRKAREYALGHLE
ncbi:MAG: hydrogenobyrinic acid a,c-diamide synthase (glutamine-hydrolyzing) [Desulfobulbaceae bacterium]|nr:hydrogenobyrinic acid a,c-diamide synthase (glutamine-hydrolyzing) [Desulfobulbaceae bacterium]